MASVPLEIQLLTLVEIEILDGPLDGRRIHIPDNPRFSEINYCGRSLLPSEQTTAEGLPVWLDNGPDLTDRHLARGGS